MEDNFIFALMNLPQNKNLLRWLLGIVAFLVVALILWNTYMFFQKFKEEERDKVSIIAEATKNLYSLSNYNKDINLELKIMESNKTIPLIITTQDGKIHKWGNLDIEGADYDKLKSEEKEYLNEELAIMKGENPPLKLERETKNGMTTDLVYYKDSDTLTRLRYYPLALVLILLLFGTVIYMVFKTNKTAEQNRLWAGMAKETAHQIGTPLSSLLGWVEILRMEENADEVTISEIEKDVERLNTIADRFSKIGSIPKLDRYNIVAETKKAFDYYESRSSKLVEFSFEIVNKEKVYGMINSQLFSWVIENLVKNAIDAMDGKGSIKLQIASKDDKYVKIDVRDSGKGIPKSLFKKIFDPGYTTKKRGWGLGLSLTKRIIEDYHGGKIYVAKSELGKGTKFTVLLNEL